MNISVSFPQKPARGGSWIRVMGSLTTPYRAGSLRVASCSAMFIPARVGREDFIILTPRLASFLMSRWTFPEARPVALLFLPSPRMKGTVLRIFPSLPDRGYGVKHPSYPRRPANSGWIIMPNAKRLLNFTYQAGSMGNSVQTTIDKE